MFPPAPIAVPLAVLTCLGALAKLSLHHPGGSERSLTFGASEGWVIRNQ